MRRRAWQQQGPDHLDLWRQIIGSIEGSYYETPRLTATGTGSSGSVETDHRINWGKLLWDAAPDTVTGIGSSGYVGADHRTNEMWWMHVHVLDFADVSMKCGNCCIKCNNLDIIWWHWKDTLITPFCSSNCYTILPIFMALWSNMNVVLCECNLCAVNKRISYSYHILLTAATRSCQCWSEQVRQSRTCVMYLDKCKADNIWKFITFTAWFLCRHIRHLSKKLSTQCLLSEVLDYIHEDNRPLCKQNRWLLFVNCPNS